jgi:hypothetical protein
MGMYSDEGMKRVRNSWPEWLAVSVAHPHVRHFHEFGFSSVRGSCPFLQQHDEDVEYHLRVLAKSVRRNPAEICRVRVCTSMHMVIGRDKVPVNKVKILTFGT